MRKSKREIHRTVDTLEPELSDEYPVIDNLAEFVSHTWEPVDKRENLRRSMDTGEVYHVDPEFRQALEGVLAGIE